MLAFLSVVFTLHRKWSFPLRISSVNVIKSAVKADSGSMTPEDHRSSRLEVLCTKDTLENFAKVTGKDQGWSLFFNKVAVLPADLVTFTEEILNGKLHFSCSASFLQELQLD